MKRFASVIELIPNKVSDYKNLYLNPWSSVIECLRDNNIGNYSIFVRGNFLFSYLEYFGHNYHSDLKIIASNFRVQKWWSLTDSYQKTVRTVNRGEWWSNVTEIFHMD
jgi:L-rhamnose mutarotase